MWKIYKLVLVFVILGLVYSIGYGQGKRYEGYKILRVVDGDTVAVINLRDNREIRMRIWGINAPETKQCFFEEAKNELEKAVANKKPRFEIMGYDGYGRLLAKVFIENEDIGGQMVRVGTAIAYDAAAVHDELKPSLSYISWLRKFEDEAKLEKLGLWGKCDW